MIVVCDGTPEYKVSKPIICPKCKRGRIGSIPEGGRAGIARRGRPPPRDIAERLLVRCAICGACWSFIIE